MLDLFLTVSLDPLEKSLQGQGLLLLELLSLFNHDIPQLDLKAFDLSLLFSEDLLSGQLGGIVVLDCEQHFLLLA